MTTGAPTSTVQVVAVLVLMVAAVALWPTGVNPLSGAAGAVTPAQRGGRTTDGAGRRRIVPARRGMRAAARQHALEGALAELVAGLAAPLRAGVSPVAAVAAAASTFGDDETLGPLLRDLSAAATRGAPVARVWLGHARRHRSPDLSFIGRAWALSELTGAPLVDALTCAEQVLRSRARSRERLAAAAAGPRASMAVLCLLPAAGPVVGLVMGVDPLTLYFSSPVATASLLVGVGLGMGAWGWSRRILRGAA